MRLNRSFQTGLVALVLVAGSLAAHSAHSETRALLVGVSVYPHLRGKNLEGPANDVLLMRSALARLAVRPENTIELSEAAGPAALPTRANILAGLDRLAQASGAGDWVLVYFSGHGAQVPQSPATRRAHPESDGLDEVFLPRDTTRWVAARGVVDGAIVDDELGAHFDRIRARGAHIWAIFDTCHAGDITRAAGAPSAAVWRVVGAADLGLQTAMGRWPARPVADAKPVRPKPARAAPTPAPTQTPTASPNAPPSPTRDGGWRTVAFFASQPDEPAAEELFADPLDPRQKRRFGVFTYHLYGALANWSGSFETLAVALERSYRDRPFPTPQFSGDLVLRFPSLAQTPLLTVAK